MYVWHGCVQMMRVHLYGCHGMGVAVRELLQMTVLTFYHSPFKRGQLVSAALSLRLLRSTGVHRQYFTHRTTSSVQ